MGSAMTGMPASRGTCSRCGVLSCLVSGLVNGRLSNDMAVSLRSERHAGELLPRAVSDHEGRQVEEQHHQEEQERGGEHHQPGGIHVRRLEAHVVDVEAEMHELALQVKEREVTIHPQ